MECDAAVLRLATPLRRLANQTGEKKGLKFEYFKLEKLIHSTKALSKIESSAKGSVENFTFPYEDKKLPSNFGLTFTGFIDISKEAIYTFTVSSNDGSKLYIADQLVVDNDGNHGTTTIDGEIALKAGIHKLRLDYFQAGGGKVLQVFIQSEGKEKTEIGDKILIH